MVYYIHVQLIKQLLAGRQLFTGARLMPYFIHVRVAGDLKFKQTSEFFLTHPGSTENHLSRQCCSQIERRGTVVRWIRDVMIRNDANSILLFPVDLAIRRVQETQMLILECHQSACILYPFMKCSALALFGFFIHFFHQGCLDRGQRCDAGLDRDCAVCWLHKWFQGLQVCVFATTAIHPAPISPHPSTHQFLCAVTAATSTSTSYHTVLEQIRWKACPWCNFLTDISLQEELLEDISNPGNWLHDASRS